MTKFGWKKRKIKEKGCSHPTKGDYGSGPLDGVRYNEEEVIFMMEMDTLKRKLGKTSLTTIQILEAAKAMGYRKIAKPTKINITRNKSK